MTDERTPEETAGSTTLRGRLLAEGRTWREATYSGHCSSCQQWYLRGAAIRINATRTGFVAECCAEGAGDEL